MFGWISSADSVRFRCVVVVVVVIAASGSSIYACVVLGYIYGQFSSTHTLWLWRVQHLYHSDVQCQSFDVSQSSRRNCRCAKHQRRRVTTAHTTTTVVLLLLLLPWYSYYLFLEPFVKALTAGLKP